MNDNLPDNEKKRTGRTATGGVFESRGKLYARVTIAPGQRDAVQLVGFTDRAKAEARAKLMNELVEILRENGKTQYIDEVLTHGATLPEERMPELRARVEAAGTKRRAKPSALPSVTTIRKLGEQWWTGELARLHPDHVRTKRSSDDDESRLGVLFATPTLDRRKFGDLAVATITLDDCDRAMAALPSTLRPATRRQYAQALAMLLHLSVYPLRLREASPVPRGWLPRVKNDKAKVWLYPSEDAALMAHTSTPLHLRLAFGVLAREGMRADELCQLNIGDVDLKRGVLRLDENKTDEPRAWALGADVVIALRGYVALHRTGTPTAAPLIVDARGERVKRDDLTRAIRPALQSALRAHDVEARTELFEGSASRLRLRVHDLRGTFVTLALAAGRTEAWVTDRTGHKSSAMLYRYKRASRTASELALGWLSPLYEAVPELAEVTVARAFIDAAAVITAAETAAGPERKPAAESVDPKSGGFSVGSEGGTRTLTGVTPADFESAASAIPPLRQSSPS